MLGHYYSVILWVQQRPLETMRMRWHHLWLFVVTTLNPTYCTHWLNRTNDVCWFWSYWLPFDRYLTSLPFGRRTANCYELKVKNLQFQTKILGNQSWHCEYYLRHHVCREEAFIAKDRNVGPNGIAKAARDCAHFGPKVFGYKSDRFLGYNSI